MPNHTILTSALSLLAAAPVATQTVAVSMRAATALTITASGSNTQTLPIGPLAPTGSLIVPSSSSFAQMQWATEARSTSATAEWNHLLPVLGSAGPHEVIMEWTSTSPVAITLEVNHWANGSVGSEVPQLAIDIGNDGLFEIFAGATFEQTFPGLTLDTQPLAVRVLFQAGALVQSGLRVRAVPDNGLQIATFDVGCVTNTTAVLPTFQNTGVAALAFLPPINVPSVLVAGLAPQPIVLPPLTTSPCLLLPRADVLVPFFTTTEIPIAIPAAARPVELWLQRAGLANGQPFTAEAFRVRAF